MLGMPSFSMKPIDKKIIKTDYLLQIKFENINYKIYNHHVDS